MFRTLLPSCRDLLVAAAWFGLGTAFYLTGAQELIYPTGLDVAPGQRVVTFAVACVAVAWRRRAPLGALALVTPVAVVDTVLFGPGLPVLLALAEMLYNATLRSSRRASRTVTVAAIASAVAATLLAGAASQDWQLGVLVGTQAVLLLVLPVWWATEVRGQRDLAEAERRNSAQQARIAELDRRAAVSAERAQLARDLHDVIAGHLSAIALQSEAVLAMAQDNQDNPATARRVLSSVRDNSVRALTEMRAMIGLLHTEERVEDAADHPARLADLERLVDSARASGLDVTTRTDDLIGTLPAAVDLTAYRIVQEALVNAVKHAAGSRAQVVVRHDGAAVVVEVTNEVNDPAPVTRTGNGLLSMRERAEAVGGSCTAGPAAGCWRVRAVLPTGMDPE